MSAVAACLATFAVTGAGLADAAPAPFSGTALWVTQVPAKVTPAALAQGAMADGAHGLYIKAGDGSTPDRQFTPALIDGSKAGGVSVCGWMHPQPPS